MIYERCLKVKSCVEPVFLPSEDLRQQQILVQQVVIKIAGAVSCLFVGNSQFAIQPAIVAVSDIEAAR